MTGTITIKVDNLEAVELVHNLDSLQVFSIVEEDLKENTSSLKRSERFKGILTKEQGKSLNDHVLKMRNEWGVI